MNACAQQRRAAESRTPSFPQIVGAEFAAAAELNDRGAILRRHEMRDTSWDGDKTAPPGGGISVRLILCHREALGNSFTGDMKYSFDVFEPRRR